LRFIPP